MDKEGYFRTGQIIKQVLTFKTNFVNILMKSLPVKYDILKL